jgi:predicted secreted Zn-dependent protease
MPETTRDPIADPLDARSPGPDQLRAPAGADDAFASIAALGLSREALAVALNRTVDAGSRRRLVGSLQPRIGNAATARLVAESATVRRSPGVHADLPPPAVQRDDGDVDLEAFWPPGGGEGTELQEGAQNPTASGTTITVVNTTYSVGGTLLQAANTLAARTEAGSVSSQFSDIYYDTSEAGIVRIANITVTETVTLPTWSGYASGTSAEKAEWDRFRVALTAHEDRHVAIDRQHFTNIHRQLVGRTRTRADEIITEKETAATTANDEFDTQTDHGRNAGTTINPPPPPAPPAQPPAP